MAAIAVVADAAGMDVPGPEALATDVPETGVPVAEIPVARAVWEGKPLALRSALQLTGCSGSMPVPSGGAAFGLSAVRMVLSVRDQLHPWTTYAALDFPSAPGSPRFRCMLLLNSLYKSSPRR